MGATLFNLFPASFRGIPFLMRVDSKSAGRKTVTFEFPNQDISYVEDLGALPASFNITAWIATVDYPQGRDRLEDALNQAGPGILVHPLYGNIEVTLNEAYTVSERMSEYGRCEFTMTFKVTAPISQPSVNSNNLPNIGRLANSVQTLATGDFASIYGLNFNSPVNFNDALNKSQTLAAQITSISNTYISDPAEAATLNAEVTNYSENAITYILNPADLATNTENLLIAFNASPATPANALLINIQLFSYGTTDEPIKILNARGEEQLRNRQMFNDYVGIFSLSNAYAAAVLFTYPNQTVLQTVVNILEDKYQSLLDSPVLTPDTLSNLKDLRVQVINYLDSLELTIPSVETITTATIPLTVLTYAYYGSTANVNALFNLNEYFNPANISGDVLILGAPNS